MQATSGPLPPIEPFYRLWIHIPHNPHSKFLTLTLTLSLTLNLALTLNLTLISSYLTNKHQDAQRDTSAYWMTSRLRDQSAAQCKKCLYAKRAGLPLPNNNTRCLGPTKRRMGAHWTAWTRIEAHGVSKKLLRRLTSMWWGTEPHGRARRRMETYPAHGHELQCNAMIKMLCYRREDCVMPMCLNEWCIVIYTCILKIWLLFYMMTLKICA